MAKRASCRTGGRRTGFRYCLSTRADRSGKVVISAPGRLKVPIRIRVGLLMEQFLSKCPMQARSHMP